MAINLFYMVHAILVTFMAWKYGNVTDIKTGIVSYFK